MTLVAVTCPTCGQTAGVPPSATVQATCNAHDQHKHRRGVTMIAAHGEAINHDNKENGE